MSGVKSCLSFIFSTIKSFDAVEKLVRDKWKQMSDAEKAPYIAETEKRRVEYAKVLNSYNQLMAAGYAEAEKRRVEYAKVLNSYNQLMAAGYAEAEKPDKSRSEVDPSSDSKEGDKSNAKANYVFHMKKKTPGLKKLRRPARGLDIPKRPTSAYFIFMEEFRKQFRELNPSIKSIAVVGKAGGSKWKQMSDAEKAPYIAEEEKRKLEYAKRMNAYNRRVAVVDAEQEESDESRS
uniref:High mobility group protein n=2 Tax=Solanum tuberosum TaxID=4113 RepID=M1BDX1_SOLTU